MPIIEANKVFVSLIALVNEENELLIGKRTSKNSFPGLWEFPGGKIQDNENPEEAIIREAKEEIGINLTKSCLAPLSFSTYKYREDEIILLLYIARKWENYPVKKIHSKLLWVKANELRNFEMPPANNYLIASIQDILI